MASVFKKSRDRNRKGASWYIAYADAQGVRRMVKGCPDKSATEAMARKLESEAELRRRGVIDPKADAYADHERRPLLAHVDDFHAYLLAKPVGAKHAAMTASRIRKVIELTGWRRPSSITLSGAHDALARLRAAGLGQETINHHVRAVKAFSRWLWKDNRVREHALAHLSTASSEADRRRVRRALSPDEARRLVQAAELAPPLKGLAGAHRAMLYRVALATGFRAEELGKLTPEAFRLDSDPPTIVCAAGYTKNHRVAEQPIPDALAALLRPFVAAFPAGCLVFPIGSDFTSDLIRADLAAAGIESRTDSGVVDFHATRTTFISHLVASGASVKVCQTLARHSTPSLTIGIYAKVGMHDLAGAVQDLPDLTRPAAGPEPMAATGTDAGHPGRSDPAAHGQRAAVGSGPMLAVAGGNEEGSPTQESHGVASRNPHDISTLDASRRELAAPVVSAGGGSRTRTRVAPERILSPPAGRIIAMPTKGLRQTPLRLAAQGKRATPDDPGLAVVVDSWPTLPEAIRAGILAMVQAAGVAR